MRRLSGGGATFRLPDRRQGGGEVTVDLPNGSTLVIPLPLEDGEAEELHVYEPVVIVRGCGFLHRSGILRAVERGGTVDQCRLGWLERGERLVEYAPDAEVTCVERTSRDGTRVARLEFGYDDWDEMCAAIVLMHRHSRLTRVRRG